jgi:transketolase
MKKENLKKLNIICSQVRRDILRMVHNAQSGHPGGSLGCTELLVALYFEIMNLKGNIANQDLFILSNGHISPVYYSVLSRFGYFPLSELATFRKINSRLQGHPTTHEGLPGIHTASGSLGQGLSVAIGAAQSKKQTKKKGKVFCLMGDGELQEGQIWEASMYAPAKKVNNLIAIVDVNGQQIDGPTQNVLDLMNLAEKFSAFGWKVLEIEDGNNMIEVVKKLKLATQLSMNVPSIILLKTVMGKGVDFMENDHKWHGSAPNDDQLEIALRQLEETIGDFPL